MWVQAKSGDLINLDKTEIVRVVEQGDKYALKAFWPSGEGETSTLTDSFTREFCEGQKDRIVQGMIDGSAVVILEKPNE